MPPRRSISQPPPPSSPSRTSLELADIFRGEAVSFLQDYGAKLSRQQRRVFNDIQACRTAALGGHVRACDSCGHREIAYNSCRNRHCPKCQAKARAAWLEDRSAELLPIPYFHIVFTLPSEVAAVALQNKRVVYGMLFAAASQTLTEVAANPRHLGAERIGIVALLHTWGQNIMHHPHLHCVVSGGGLADGDSRWVASREYFFLPVRVLSRVFRNKFRALLDRAFGRGELEFFGDLRSLSDPAVFQGFLDAATRREWVVYAKKPFGSPATVLKYLAGYTHRVAISNRRLLSYRDGQVTIRYKDYARQGKRRTVTLGSGEFIRRFLLHVLPSGFMRIRHYGYLANCHRREKLETCRRLLGCEVPAVAECNEQRPDENSREDGIGAGATIRCPVCETGRMQTIETFDGRRYHNGVPFAPLLLLNVPYQDSS